MNNSYTTLQTGEHLVSDENSMRKVEHNDNIHEILVDENELEQVEKDIEVREKNLKEKKERKKLELSITLIFSILAIVSPIVMPPLIFDIFGAIELVSTTIGIIPNYLFATFALGIVFIPFGIGLAKCGYTSNKIMKAHIKGQESSLEFLNQKKTELNNKINELSSEKTKDNVSEPINYNDIIKVDDEKVLKDLIDCTNFYYECGYNEKEYLKYYLNGILRHELSGKYTPEQLALVEQKMVELQKRKLEVRSNKAKMFIK